MSVPENKIAATRQFLGAAYPREASAAAAVEGISPFNVLGRAAGLDSTAMPATIHGDVVGSTLYPYPTAEVSLEISSDSAEDFPLGLGAGRVVVIGLNFAFERTVELFTMAGLAVVAGTRTDWFRISRVLIFAPPGVAGANVGKLTVRVAGGGPILATMLPLEGRSRDCVQSVPSDSTAVLTSFHGDIINAQGNSPEFLEFALLRRPNFRGSPLFDDVPGSWEIEASWVVRSNATSHARDNISTPLVLPSLYDVEIRCLSADSMGIQACSTIEGFLIDNDLLTDVLP